MTDPVKTRREWSGALSVWDPEAGLRSPSVTIDGVDLTDDIQEWLCSTAFQQGGNVSWQEKVSGRWRITIERVADD